MARGHSMTVLGAGGCAVVTLVALERGRGRGGDGTRCAEARGEEGMRGGDGTAVALARGGDGTAVRSKEELAARLARRRMGLGHKNLRRMERGGTRSMERL